MKTDIIENSIITAVKPDLLKSNSNNHTSGNSNFVTYLNDALKEVNNLQQEASQSAKMLALGEADYLHNTMIAYQKANLALQLTVEVRNKILEAYQEIMRIQL